jgi:hypothetical protein
VGRGILLLLCVENMYYVWIVYLFLEKNRLVRKVDCFSVFFVFFRFFFRAQIFGCAFSVFVDQSNTLDFVGGFQWQFFCGANVLWLISHLELRVSCRRILRIFGILRS